MQHFLRISEAVSLAFHTMGLLAGNPNEVLRTADIAKTLKASEHHLQKVHQRLAKAGFIQAVRGPKGGFRLKRPANEISLLDIYLALEGPLTSCTCLLGCPSCLFQDCMLGNLVERVNTLVREHLETCTIDQLTKLNKERQ